MFEGYFERMVLQVLSSIAVIFGIQLCLYWIVNRKTKYNIPLLERIVLSVVGTVIIYGVTLAIIGE